MADISIANRATVPAPNDYVVADAQDLLVKAVRAVINGAAAGGTYLPALQLISPAGDIMWTAVPPSNVAAGVSVDVSWFPWGGGLGQATATTPSGGGGGGGGGGAPAALQVTDGTTTVTSVTDIDFVSGATVASGGGGRANVTSVGSGTPSFSGARIYSSVNQSIPNTTDTTQTFDTVQFDVGGYSNLGTHNTRLTAPSTGYYAMGACVAFPNGNYYTQVYTFVNGVRATASASTVTAAPTAGTNPDLMVASIYKLNAGDYMEVGVVQESGAAANSLSAPPTVPSFWMSLIGV